MRDDMETTKGQVANALKRTGDDPASLVCFYRPKTGERYHHDEFGPVVRCTFDELPTREFDAGYGGVEGEPVICFSERYVYVKGCYDGSEWVSAVPRNPDSVGDTLPVIGGG